MKRPLLLIGMVFMLPVVGGAQTSEADCEQAWASYNEFKRRTVMEPSQYPLTQQGEAVRAACGRQALPAPPGTDTVPVYRVPAPPQGRRPPDHRPPEGTRPAPGEHPRPRDWPGLEGRPAEAERPPPEKPHPPKAPGRDGAGGEPHPPAEGASPWRALRPGTAPRKSN